MTALVFVDTNVLLYRHDAASPQKQEAAQEWLEYLWRTQTGRVSVQILQEFYVNATRKLKPGLDRQVAQEEIQDLFSWHPMLVSTDTIEAAWKVQERFGLSFWDSLVVASAQLGGCRYLLTEDLQHGQDLGGVRVLDPFQSSPSVLALG